MNFNAHYWPTLDDPGSWLNYQVNQITQCTLHPNGWIDVTGRQQVGFQYITLLKHPDFDMVGQVYSTATNNVPPAKIDPLNTLWEAMGPDGIGEVASGVPWDLQIPPLLILPNNLTTGFVYNGSSCITGQGGASYTFKYTTSVLGVGTSYGPWVDTVKISYVEPANNEYYCYVFAAGAVGQTRGLVSFWTAKKDPVSGAITPGLEYFAAQAGHI